MLLFFLNRAHREYVLLNSSRKALKFSALFAKNEGFVSRRLLDVLSDLLCCLKVMQLLNSASRCITLTCICIARVYVASRFLSFTPLETVLNRIRDNGRSFCDVGERDSCLKAPISPTWRRALSSLVIFL